MVYLYVVFKLFFLGIVMMVVVHVIVNCDFMCMVEIDELYRIKTGPHCHAGIDRWWEINDPKSVTLPMPRGNVKIDQYSRCLRILMVSN